MVSMTGEQYSALGAVFTLEMLDCEIVKTWAQVLIDLKAI
jgi:hypothetical protein